MPWKPVQDLYVNEKISLACQFSFEGNVTRPTNNKVTTKAYFRFHLSLRILLLREHTSMETCTDGTKSFSTLDVVNDFSSENLLLNPFRRAS